MPCMFFFFNQKTAYEMRISDWSSDVCSSDLPCPPATPASTPPTRSAWSTPPSTGPPPTPGAPTSNPPAGSPTPPRSEEHTSELQSLMRSSYDVFCLKKKKQDKKIMLY